MKNKFFRGVRSDLESSYELLNHLGRGACAPSFPDHSVPTSQRRAHSFGYCARPSVDGEVWAAKDPTNNSEKVAIKKIHNCFVQATEAKRILRELRILRHVSHPNIIRIRDLLHPQVRDQPPGAHKEGAPQLPFDGWNQWNLDSSVVLSGMPCAWRSRRAPSPTSGWCSTLSTSICASSSLRRRPFRWPMFSGSRTRYAHLQHLTICSPLTIRILHHPLLWLPRTRM